MCFYILVTWGRPSVLVVCRPAAVQRCIDRVEKAATEWGGQFWPQPASAGFPCCPAGDIQAPHFFMKFRGPQALCNRPQKAMSHYASSSSIFLAAGSSFTMRKLRIWLARAGSLRGLELWPPFHLDCNRSEEHTSELQ